MMTFDRNHHRHPPAFLIRYYWAGAAAISSTSLYSTLLLLLLMAGLFPYSISSITATAQQHQLLFDRHHQFFNLTIPSPPLSNYDNNNNIDNNNFLLKDFLTASSLDQTADSAARVANANVNAAIGSDGEYRKHYGQQLQMQTSFAAMAATASELLNGRAFFATVTLTVATSWSTYYITTTTTCTTSTTNIKVCSPSKGRRRRGDLGIHRLMFEKNDKKEEEDEEEGEESPFNLDHNDKNRRINQSSNQYSGDDDGIEKDSTAVGTSTSTSETVSPFVVQPGFDGTSVSKFGVYQHHQPQGRFLIAFGTSTAVTTSTVTYSYILTATCQSTTLFQTCGTGANSIG